MSKNLKIVSLVFACLLFVMMMFVGSYNGIQSSKVDVDAKWSQVENQMQRRFDLIPNLVETVKGSSIHEEKVVAEIANARAKMGSASNPVQKDEVNTEFNGTLSRLMMLSENYPDLKANAQFNKLMDDLSGAENRIFVAKKDYIASVQTYTLKTTTFPGNIFSSIFGFEKIEQLKADEAAKTAPKVSF